MQLKILLPKLRQNQPEFWDRLDPTAQQKFLQTLAKVLRRTLNQNEQENLSDEVNDK